MKFLNTYTFLSIGLKHLKLKRKEHRLNTQKLPFGKHKTQEGKLEKSVKKENSDGKSQKENKNRKQFKKQLRESYLF